MSGKLLSTSYGFSKHSNSRFLDIHPAKDPEHVAAGYKAAIHNPNVSQEAKDHAWKELHKMGIHDLESVIHEVPQQTGHAAQGTYSEAKNQGNVIGGYKATLKSTSLPFCVLTPNKLILIRSPCVRVC
jgi:hypothetical protein